MLCELHFGLRRREPACKLDHNAVERSLPVAEGQRLFLAEVARRQVEQLDQRLVAAKRASVLGDLAQAHVDRPDRDMVPPRVISQGHRSPCGALAGRGRTGSSATGCAPGLADRPILVVPLGL